MVVIVRGAVLVERRQPGWFDPAHQSGCRQHGQSVVHRLDRDSTDAGSNLLDDPAGVGVWMRGQDLEDGEALFRGA